MCVWADPRELVIAIATRAGWLAGFVAKWRWVERQEVMVGGDTSLQRWRAQACVLQGCVEGARMRAMVGQRRGRGDARMRAEAGQSRGRGGARKRTVVGQKRGPRDDVKQLRGRREGAEQMRERRICPRGRDVAEGTQRRCVVVVQREDMVAGQRANVGVS